MARSAATELVNGGHPEQRLKLHQAYDLVDDVDRWIGEQDETEAGNAEENGILQGQLAVVCDTLERILRPGREECCPPGHPPHCPHCDGPPVEAPERHGYQFTFNVAGTPHAGDASCSVANCPVCSEPPAPASPWQITRCLRCDHGRVTGPWIEGATSAVRVTSDCPTCGGIGMIRFDGERVARVTWAEETTDGE